MDESYYKLLKENYNSKREVRNELISLGSKLYLPKGTEYFFSDIHGEASAFLQLLKSASGNIREKTSINFGDTLLKEEQDRLTELVYNPKEVLHELELKNELTEDFLTINIHRLISLFRFVSTKYAKDYVKEKFGDLFSPIVDELLYTNDSEYNKKTYYDKLVENVVKYGAGKDFIILISTFIQRISVDKLHVVGDIFDRGPAPQVIIDELIGFPNIDIQWGNHDIEWMGAVCGNKALTAACLANAIQYSNFDMLEDGYAINLRPLYEFAMTTYGDDSAEIFMPRVFDKNLYDNINDEVAAKMFKAISIIRYKLDGKLLERNPEFKMDDRNFLRHIDYKNMTYKGVPLKDTNFPTVDPDDPLKLTPEEECVISVLQKDFKRSMKLNKHIKFLYENGSLYKVENGSLLFHGCIPLNEDGAFTEIEIKGKKYWGKSLMDKLEEITRDAYYKSDDYSIDFIWYLFNGEYSPIFGKSQFSYFENLFVDDKKLREEVYNPYFSLCNKEEIVDMILDEFEVKSDRRRIINGHVPVKTKKGDSPVKAKGKLYVIDGGISKPYQAKTGIAGYTLVFNSHSVSLAEHSNYESITDEVSSYKPNIREVEVLHPRMLIKDTDEGKTIQERINVLEKLLKNYDNL